MRHHINVILTISLCTTINGCPTLSFFLITLSRSAGGQKEHYAWDGPREDILQSSSRGRGRSVLYWKVTLRPVSCEHRCFFLLPFLLSTHHPDWWAKCFSPFMHREARDTWGLRVSGYTSSQHLSVHSCRLDSSSKAWVGAMVLPQFSFKGEFSSVCFSQWLLPRLLSNASSVELLVNHSCTGGLRVKASLHGGVVGFHITEGAWWPWVTLAVVPPKLGCFSSFKRVKSPHWTSRSSLYLPPRASCRLGVECLHANNHTAGQRNRPGGVATRSCYTYTQIQGL